MKKQGPSNLARSLSAANQQSICFSPNIRQIELINELLATGYWGGSPAEVVRRLIDRSLETYANNK